jgi:lipopolysaccharide export LptBFGC system permease protein LptF
MTKLQRIFALLTALVVCLLAGAIVVGLNYGSVAVGVMLIGLLLAAVALSLIGLVSEILSDQL